MLRLVEHPPIRFSARAALDGTVGGIWRSTTTLVALAIACVALVMADAAAAGWLYEGGSPRRSNASSHGVSPPWRTLWTQRPHPKGVEGGLIEHGVTIAEGHVYVVTIGGTVAAISESNGKIVWRRTLPRRGGGVFATAPAYHRGALYVNARGPGGIWKLDASTGRIVWKRRYRGNSEGGPLVVGGAIYVNISEWPDGRGRIYRYAPGGRVVWRRPIGCGVTNGPTWTGRHIVAANRCGGVYGYTRSGRRVWHTRLSRAPNGAHAFVNATRGRLYVHTKDNWLYALSPVRGRILWARRTGVGVAYGSCAASKRMVYCANGYRDRRLSAWTRRGRRVWTTSSRGRVLGDAVLIRGIVWLASFSNSGKGKVHGFNARNGRLKFRFRSGRYSPAASSGNLIYIIHSRHIEALQSARTAL
jgi:outer membrane protein assembly factor BamB